MHTYTHTLYRPSNSPFSQNNENPLDYFGLDSSTSMSAEEKARSVCELKDAHEKYQKWQRRRAWVEVLSGHNFIAKKCQRARIIDWMLKERNKTLKLLGNEGREETRDELRVANKDVIVLFTLTLREIQRRICSFL